MKIGYARVSSNSQDLEIQSGKNNERAELKKSLNALREGDVNL